jgi:gliding motility-associated-like protein
VQITFRDSSYFVRTFAWDFDDGTNSINPNPAHTFTAPGFYDVKLVVISPGGCRDSMVKRISVYPQTGSFTYGPLANCGAVNVRFDAVTRGRARFRWDFGDGASSVTNDSFVVHNYSLIGRYLPKLIIEDLTGCLIPLVGTDSISVEKVVPGFRAIPQTFCDTGTVQFIDTSSIQAAATFYKWYFGDGDSSTVSNPRHTYIAPGRYTVSLILNTSNGCRDTLTKTNVIVVNPTPLASIIGDSSACVPASLNYAGLLANPDTSIVTWNWNFGNGQTSTLQNPLPTTYNAVGNYTIRMTASSDNGCAKTDSLQLVINPIPDVVASMDTTVCFGQNAFLNATGAFTYDWSRNPTGLSCQFCPNPNANTANDTWYYVTGTSADGCQKEDSVLVKVLQPYALNVSTILDSICFGGGIRVTASGAPRYLWSPDSTLNNATLATPLLRPRATTTYKVLGYDSLNCFNDSINVVIRVNANPTVNVGPDVTIQQGASTTLTGITSNDATNYLWRPNYELSCTACSTTVATPKQNTQYILTVTNASGCSRADSITVFVICNDKNIFIPNTFSPNGDGMNDVFYVRGKGLFSIKSIRIFNRVGQLVFERRDFSPNDPSVGWNGRVFDQKPVGTDSYLYVVEVLCENSYLIKLQGNVTLIQ